MVQPSVLFQQQNSTENSEAGVQVGTLKVGPLVFVDDVIDISDNLAQVITSHEHAKSFTNRKRLQFSTKAKCKILIINKQVTDSIPKLEINGEILPIVSFANYLGDVFNAARKQQRHDR